MTVFTYRDNVDSRDRTGAVEFDRTDGTRVRFEKGKSLDLTGDEISRLSRLIQLVPGAGSDPVQLLPAPIYTNPATGKIDSTYIPPLDGTDALLGQRRFDGEPRVRRRADLTLHPTPPVRTSVTGTPPAVPANMRFVPWDSPLLRWSTPLVPAVTGASAPGTPSIHGMMTSSHLTGTVDESLQGPMPYRLDVMIDGSSITLPLGSPLNASPKCHLYVDGMLATADEELLSGGGMAMHTWAFADAGPRELCFMLKNASVKGVYVPVNGQVFTPPWPQGPRVVFIGDSLTEGAVATSHSRGYAHLAAWMLGYDNYSCNAFGGTGFLADNGSPLRLNTLQRIGEILSLLTPNDLVIWVLGCNDASKDQVLVKANVKSCFQQVKATGAKQIAFGPWYLEVGTSAAPVHQTIRQAAAEVGIPFVPTMNFDRWLRAAGHGGNPISSIGPAIVAEGNADRYSSGSVSGSVGNQSVHPLNAGHVAMAKWLTARVREAVKPSYQTPLVVPGAYPHSTAASLWYDETGHGVTADAAAISQWTDRSGSGAHLLQATAAAQPLHKVNIQNGLAGVLFDGTNDELLAATGAQLRHIFAVGKYLAATFGGFNGLFMGAGNNNADTLLQGGAAAVAEVQTLTGTATGGTFTLTDLHTGMTTATIPFNGTAAQVQTALTAIYNGIVCGGGPLGTAGVTVTYPTGHGTRPMLVVNGANLTGGAVTVARTTTGVSGKMMYVQAPVVTPRYWRDGEEQSRQEVRGPMNATGLLEMTSTELTNPLVPRVGSHFGLGGRFWSGYAFEFIGFPVILSDAEALATRNYLLNKWGLVNWAAL